MKKQTQMLVLSIGIGLMGLSSAYAQNTAPPPAAAETTAPAAEATPAEAAPATEASPLKGGPSYDQVKTAFLEGIKVISEGLNSPEMDTEFAGLQSLIDKLAQIETDYTNAKAKVIVTQAELEALVKDYVDTVNAIQQKSEEMSQGQQQTAGSVNEALQFLQLIDKAKAEADAKINAAVDGLNKLMHDKFAGPMERASKIVAPVVDASKSALEARMPLLIAEELARSVANHLESSSVK